MLERAILEAALEQLRGGGYAGLTMEAVAAAAGTGKAALYHRWSNKDELVADALRSVLPDPAAVPLADDPRQDVLALLKTVRDTIELSRGKAFRTVKSEGGGSGSALVQLLVKARVTEPCLALIVRTLERGATAGLVRADRADARTAGIGIALLMYHVLNEGPEITDEYLDWIVDGVVLPAVRP